MNIEKFKEAQELYSKIREAERKLLSIDDLLQKSKSLLITDGVGCKFDISNELELEIKNLIKQSFQSDLNKLKSEFEEL